MMAQGHQMIEVDEDATAFSEGENTESGGGEEDADEGGNNEDGGKREERGRQKRSGEPTTRSGSEKSQ